MGQWYFLQAVCKTFYLLSLNLRFVRSIDIFLKNTIKYVGTYLLTSFLRNANAKKM